VPFNSYQEQDHTIVHSKKKHTLAVSGIKSNNKPKKDVARRDVAMHMVRFDRVLVPTWPNPRRSELDGLETGGFDGFHGPVATRDGGTRESACRVSHGAAERTTRGTCGQGPGRPLVEPDFGVIDRFFI
jgi:hypothetical protein